TRRPAPGESPARSPGFVFSATAGEALDDAWPSVASHNSEHDAPRPGFQGGRQRFTQARRIGAKPNAAPSQAELRLTCPRLPSTPVDSTKEKTTHEQAMVAVSKALIRGLLIVVP